MFLEEFQFEVETNSGNLIFLAHFQSVATCRLVAPRGQSHIKASGTLVTHEKHACYPGTGTSTSTTHVLGYPGMYSRSTLVPWYPGTSRALHVPGTHAPGYPGRPGKAPVTTFCCHRHKASSGTILYWHCCPDTN